MRLTDAIRYRLRKWLLTESERELVDTVAKVQSRTESNKSDISDVRGEWSEFQRALDHAEIVGEHEIESVDMLVLTGRQHHVSNARFGDGIYINGREHVVTDCVIDSPEDSTGGRD